MIQNGEVQVNGEVDTRRGKKLYDGDTFTYQGETVKVISGPFEGFMGTVEEISNEKQILKVKVSMFGRETPVELEFSQVDKI